MALVFPWDGLTVWTKQELIVQLSASASRWLVWCWHDSFIWITWLIHLCDMTHSCVTLLDHMCAMTHSYVLHDSFICVTLPMHMCDVPHLHVWFDSFMCVTWLIDMWDIMHTCLKRLIHTCGMTHRVVRHDAYVCNTIHSYSPSTEWRRVVGYLIIIGHFSQKSPIISGSFAGNDMRHWASYESLPPTRAMHEVRLKYS